MGRKLALAVIILLIFGGFQPPSSAEAIAYDFSKQYGNYDFSAQMAISIDGNKLTLTLDNTSPYFEKAEGVQTFHNAPAIVGFSFSISNRAELTISSWDLQAVKANDPKTKKSIKGIGEQWQRNSSLWSYNNFVIQNYDNHGYLYSPGVKWADIAKSDFEYFTSAVLEIEFSGTPTLSLTDSPYIKAYYPGYFFVENSDKFISGKLVATPEPGTLLLLGLGLIGIAIVMREML